MEYSRRELCVLLPALLAARADGVGNAVLPSKVYNFDSLPAKVEQGNAFRAILEGVTHEGYQVELHETDLAPGTMPHPAHHHDYYPRSGTIPGGRFFPAH